MARYFSDLFKLILGIDDTELPTNQINYIKDIAETKNTIKINEDNMFLFIDSLKEKHDLNEISLFKNGIPIFSSETQDLDKVSKIHELFSNNKKLMNDKVLLLKDKSWISVYEKENFVFVVKRTTKLNEFEINAITTDVLKNLDNVMVEERNMIENIYTKNIMR